MKTTTILANHATIDPTSLLDILTSTVTTASPVVLQVTGACPGVSNYVLLGELGLEIIDSIANKIKAMGSAQQTLQIATAPVTPAPAPIVPAPVPFGGSQTSPAPVVMQTANPSIPAVNPGSHSDLVAGR